MHQRHQFAEKLIEEERELLDALATFGRHALRQRRETTTLLLLLLLLL
jgi:hypothetical protein